MVIAETSFWDAFWWMVVFFFWVMAIWLFIALISDIIRRDDINGWKKAGWIILMIVLPFIGALVYIIARPKMTEQDVRLMTQSEAAQRAAAGVSTADELAKLDDLRSRGVLNEDEYQSLRQKALDAT